MLNSNELSKKADIIKKEPQPHLSDLFQMALDLTKTHPKAFALSDVSNDWCQALVVRTMLRDSENTYITIEIFRHIDDTTQSLMVYQNDKCTYRLDQVSNEQSKQERQSFLDLISEYSQTEPSFINGLKTMLENYHLQPGGSVIAYHDSYAETSITAAQAIALLRNCTPLLPPLTPGEVRLSDVVLPKVLLFDKI